MAAFKRKFAKRINSKPCEWCGWKAASRFASHIIDARDGGPEKNWNALSLCPNCSSVFDDVIRPKLYNALENFGVKNLPKSWKKSNKLSESNTE